MQQSLGRQFVLVVSKGDTVRSHDVTPGPWSGERWIIEKGLASGDRVIVDGVQKAMPGSVVHPVPAADTAAAGGLRPHGAGGRLLRRRGGGRVMSHPPVHQDQEVRYFFIRRPVLAAVISIVIVLLGLFALLRLPVSRYPQITPPAVQVSATYPGATAEDVAQAVAAPIEQQLSGLDGLLYYKSSNSSNGVMNLQVYFDIGRDQDLAAVDVQNAIKVAEPQLPEEVRRQGVVIKKAQTDILLVASLTSKDPRYDATFLANYAKLYIVDELKRLNGVGDASVFGGLDFAMTIRLDPDRMTQLGITVGDVRDAVQEQNATNPAGTLGREPSPPGTELTLPVTAQGRLQTRSSSPTSS